MSEYRAVAEFVCKHCGVNVCLVARYGNKYWKHCASWRSPKSCGRKLTGADLQPKKTDVYCPFCGEMVRFTDVVRHGHGLTLAVPTEGR